MGLTFVSFYIKLEFWREKNNKKTQIIFLLHKNIMKISEILNKWNLLKICIQTTLPYQFLQNLQPFLLWEKWNLQKNFKTIE